MPELPALTVDDLRRIPQMADLPAEELTWLLPRLRVWEVSPGEEYIHFGQPVDDLAILLDGEMEVVDRNGDGVIWVVRPGEIFGMLPYSRMQVSPGTGRAIRPSRLAALHKDHFPALVRECPGLVQRLCGR
jgi:CRP-like cAMP-binding protein